MGGLPGDLCHSCARTVDGSNTTPWHWLMLVVHTVIAICLVLFVVISVHDSLSLRETLSEEDASPASCERPRYRSYGGLSESSLQETGSSIRLLEF